MKPPGMENVQAESGQQHTPIQTQPRTIRSLWIFLALAAPFAMAALINMEPISAFLVKNIQTITTATGITLIVLAVVNQLVCWTTLASVYAYASVEKERDEVYVTAALTGAGGLIVAAGITLLMRSNILDGAGVGLIAAGLLMAANGIPIICSEAAVLDKFKMNSVIKCGQWITIAASAVACTGILVFYRSQLG